MRTIRIAVPNDYGSDDAYRAAIAEVYGGDDATAAEDLGQELYCVLGDIASGAGLVYVRATDYGAEWRGTAAQVAAVRQALPTWASVADID